ncbi:MAG: S-layer homology domain-containing protein, partial [Acidimicrobiaceae bacterium]|nr:S-layer homology domain-containing protein [Acidimicrobiaceae bacterium]
LQATESADFTRGDMMVLLKAINDGTLHGTDAPEDPAAGATGAGGGQRFSDVGPGHYAFEAVEWAAEAGVTVGYDDGTFKPARALSRRHALVFMERYYDEILQATESADFTRGDMMVLLKAINDGLAPTPIGTPSTPGPWPPLPALATRNPASLVDERGSNLGAYGLWGVDWLHTTRPVRENRIRELPWVRDGIGVSEMEAVQGLILLGLYGNSLFFDVIEQQWVSEGANGPAMSSLGRLAAANPEAFEGVMAHPTVSDGISDQEAAIVATLWRVAMDAPSLVEVLLDSEQTTLEERTITLPLAGQVPVTIIRTKLGAAVTMDRIEAAAGTVESFMSLPLPGRRIIWLFIEEAGGTGSNSGTHITTRPRVDDAGYTKNDYETSFPDESALRHFTHEISHKYWGHGETWIIEGAATFIEALAVNLISGEPFAMERFPCPYARNIAELQRLNLERGDPAQICHYQTGERVFHDLYRNMDDTTFRLAFRRLHLLSLFDDPNDQCEDRNLNVCHLRAAFTTDVPEETAALARKVIDRWYDGSEPFDLSLIEDVPVDPELPQINGRIEEAYLNHNRISASEDTGSLLFTFEFSHQDAGSFHVPVQIVEAYEDGFIHRRQRRTLTPSDQGTETVWVSRTWPRAIGKHWVIVYAGDRKVAQVQYEVTP